MFQNGISWNTKCTNRDGFCRDSHIIMWFENSGPIAMYEPRKSNDISCKNTFGVKIVSSSKVESYLEVNTWTDWGQQDLLLEYGQGLTYWIRKYHTGYIIASYVTIVFKI